MKKNLDPVDEEDVIYLDWDEWIKLIRNKSLSFTDIGILSRLFLWVREDADFFMSTKDWAKEFEVTWPELHECFQRLQGAEAIVITEQHGPEKIYSIKLVAKLFYRGGDSS